MPHMNRPLAAATLRTRLPDELFRLATDGLVRSGKSAKTLVKDGPLRVSIIRLAAGGRIAEHQADGPITLQGLDGAVRLRVAGETWLLEAGDLVSVAAGVRHEVESADGGAFLLTVALPIPGPAGDA